jgi:hypothetical protein
MFFLIVVRLYPLSPLRESGERFGLKLCGKLAKNMEKLLSPSSLFSHRFYQ